VHGHGGLDELTTTGPNRVSYFGLVAGSGGVVTETLDPEAYGFAAADLGDLRGGTPEENADITRNVLSGAESGPRRDTVILNAGAALLVGGLVGDLQEGIALAAESIDSGAAVGKLRAMVEHSQALADREPA
jgi:anthranilate phosphoribosyltransferase